MDTSLHSTTNFYNLINRAFSHCVINHVTTRRGVQSAIAYNGDVYCYRLFEEIWEG